METIGIIFLGVVVLIIGVGILVTGMVKDNINLITLGMFIIILPTALLVWKLQSLQKELDQYPIEKNRIYEYEILDNDTIPIDTIYTEGMSGKTYYYKII